MYVECEFADACGGEYAVDVGGGPGRIVRLGVAGVGLVTENRVFSPFLYWPGTDIFSHNPREYV